MPTRADLDLEESLPAIMPFVVSIGRPDWQISSEWRRPREEKHLETLPCREEAETGGR